ncbi:MAG: hypothetical protein ACRDXX_13375 [Stackebrandtia sp.]
MIATASTQWTQARTCGDHLAGQLGVRITRSLLEAGVLDGDLAAFDAGEFDLALTDSGGEFLGRVGIRVPQGPRPLAQPCMDCSERRSHLSGRLGAAVLHRALKSEWVRRRPDGAVVVTDAGRRALRSRLGVEA